MSSDIHYLGTRRAKHNLTLPMVSTSMAKNAVERNISHKSMRMHMDAADWVVSKNAITNYCFRTLFFILPWVPEVFLACSGNFRCWPKADTSSAVGRSREKNAGHYEDLTETGNRARKVSGTQGIFI